MRAIGKSALIWVLAGVSLGASSCDKTSEIRNWVNQSASLRESAENQLPNIPYRRPQHEAFKAYFSELNHMALALGRDEKLKGRFNESAAQGDFKVICQKIFMHRSRWDSLVQGCTKNRFFLCAEEVRAYPEMVQSLRGALRTDLQHRFDGAVNCQAASR